MNAADSKENQENNDNSSSSIDNDEEKFELTLPIQNKKKNKNKSTVKSNDDDPRKLDFNALASSAQDVIKTISRCKKLVQYVKKSGCNKDIQGLGGVALQQSTVIRWLSMIDLLQSIVRSY
ncbi:unnamed protein product [Rotaria sp. Silwood2]|nr:unnamed protein product [Rotaria sp. Silwood2]CAF4196894.1 unnamed protein product [Rotaria sp. Silwood2]